MSRAYDGPRSLSDSLKSLVGRYRKVDLGAVDEIRSRWTEVVGEALAERCEPELMKEGVLIVRVPTGAFAERLRMDEKTILESFADLGERAPTSLRTVVGKAPENPR